MTNDPDFIIIGAGINGLLLARNLLASGAHVTLIDRGQPGQEASWAGGGIVSPLYPWRYSDAITALSGWAQEYYPQLAQDLYEETGIDVECQVSGLLMLDSADRDAAISWAAANGRQLLELDAQEIYQREADLAAGYGNGLWMPQIANIRNPRLCKALLASLQKSEKFQLLQECAVSSFDCRGGRLASLLLDSQPGSAIPTALSVKGASVIVCAGAWSGNLLARLNLAIDVHPVKGQMLLYKFPSPPIKSIVLTAGRYLIPRVDGHVLVGSTLEYCGFDKQASTEARTSLIESAARILPLLADMEPVRQWAGLRPGSGDGVPFIGKIPGMDNLYINAGQFRNGLVLAPASAQLLGDLLLGRQPIMDPAPFAPDRKQNAGEMKLA